MTTPISGFSKLSKAKKIDWLNEHYTKDSEASKKLISAYWNQDSNLQQLHEEFIENTITNLYMPLGIAPNFLINDQLYAIPMAIEESSVVAAASKAAKFWFDRGGFKSEIIGTEKIGQVHFMYYGDSTKLEKFFTDVHHKLLEDAKPLTKNMEKRGGGISKIELRDKTSQLKDYYQLHCTFETMDAMGANFINSCLEQFAQTFKNEAQRFSLFTEKEKQIEMLETTVEMFTKAGAWDKVVGCYNKMAGVDPTNWEARRNIIAYYKQHADSGEIGLWLGIETSVDDLIEAQLDADVEIDSELYYLKGKSQYFSASMGGTLDKKEAAEQAIENLKKSIENF
jgi:hypothetical protein